MSKTRSWKNTFQNIPFILRLLALSCIIIALARPQTKFEEQQSEGEGVDIILCIDVSGSMTAQDFTPNRMEAAKKVAEDFVEQSTNRQDRDCNFFRRKFYAMPAYNRSLCIKKPD